MEGDLARTIEANLGRIAHIQLADNPGRHEPGTGEINYPFLYEHIDRIGYAGWVGAEYKPKAGTEAGLGGSRHWPGRAAARGVAANILRESTRKTSKMETIGFIGLGIMGAPMAGHLLDAGYQRRRQRPSLEAAGRSRRQGPEDRHRPRRRGEGRRHHHHHGAGHAAGRRRAVRRKRRRGRPVARASWSST